jgi:hypothetical protein
VHFATLRLPALQLDLRHLVMKLRASGASAQRLSPTEMQGLL